MNPVLHMGLVAAAVMLLAAPALGGKLDQSRAPAANVGAAPAVETGEAYFAALLPLTSTVMAKDFAADHAEIAGMLNEAIGAGQTRAARQTTLADNLSRIAIGYELKLLDAPDAAVTAVINRQADYVNALLAGEGAAVCSPAIYDGSRVLIGLGLWEKYAPQIDATLAAYFKAVRLALDSPTYVGAMTSDDASVVVAQMVARGDKALMDHFGVMERDSPENCPAVLAIIETSLMLNGATGVRVRAAQARGASRL